MRKWDPELRQRVSRKTPKAQFETTMSHFFFAIKWYIHSYFTMIWVDFCLSLCFFSTSVAFIGKHRVPWPPPWPQNPNVTAWLNCSWKWQQIRGTQIPQGVSCTSSRLLLVWYISTLTCTMLHLLHLPRAKWALQSKQTAEEWTWTTGQIFGSRWCSPSGL